MDKGKISWIYLHGVELEQKDTNGRLRRYWLCKPCYDNGVTRPRPNASTSSCGKHLTGKAHSIMPPGTPAIPSESIDHYLEEQHPLYAERWQTSFINWIVSDDVSWDAAASPALRQMVIHGGPLVRDLLPSRHTVRAWFMNTYNERQSDVVTSLTNSQSKIVLSLDGWSAPNNLPLLGVVGHWLDNDHQLKTALLGLRPLEGHAGTDIADVLYDVMKTYNLTDNAVSAFQMDNATNNDTALKSLSEMTSLDPAKMRLRCLGHIINLVVKALLFGKATPSFQKDLQEASDVNTFRLWRQQGAIGHLHNLVTYIGRSPSRLRAFEASQKVDATDLVGNTLHLMKDGGVRWNSTYYMIKRALRLQDALRQYCRDWRPAPHELHDLKKDFLDPQDWEELRHFEELLQPFERVVKRVEGNAYSGSHGALWEVIPTMDYLFAKLKKAADEVSENETLFTDCYTNCLNYGFLKLKEYYNVIDASPYYAAAVALHPCQRFTYFEDAWASNAGGATAILAAKQSTRRLFDDYLRRACAERETSPMNTLFINDESDDDWATYLGDRTKANDRTRGLQRRQETELERFMEDMLDIDYTEKQQGKVLKLSYFNQPLRWWRERGQALYPTLSTVAFDLFAMPGMSSECERAFSAAKRMITDDRYNLKCDIIEADQCVKSWLKSGIVDGRAAFINIAGTKLEDLE
jgi:hypothetical protein